MFVVFDDFQFFDRMFWRQHNTQVLKCHQLLQWSEEIYSIFIDVTKIIKVCLFISDFLKDM